MDMEIIQGKKYFADISFTGKKDFPDGSTAYFFNGKLHSFNDFPAVVDNNGDCYWFKNGELYRENDKAPYISVDGTQYWIKNGLIHRDNDLPAVVGAGGTQKWYQNNELHRDNDLPAVIEDDGSQYWYQNGFKHRDYDKPAAVFRCYYGESSCDYVWKLRWCQKGGFYKETQKPWYRSVKFYTKQTQVKNSSKPSQDLDLQ